MLAMFPAPATPTRSTSTAHEADTTFGEHPPNGRRGVLEADCGLGQVLRMPAILVLEGEYVVVSAAHELLEDVWPRHDAGTDDPGPDRPFLGLDPRGVGGPEWRIGILEDQILDVHVTDEVTLDGEGLLPGLVVGEGQVRLVVQDADGGRVDLADKTGGVGGRLRHGAEVVLDAEHHAGVLRPRARGR